MAGVNGNDAAAESLSKVSKGGVTKGGRKRGLRAVRDSLASRKAESEVLTSSDDENRENIDPKRTKIKLILEQ